MPEYAQSFAENRSNFCVLSDLTDQYLKDKRVTVGWICGQAIGQINLFDLPVDYDGVGRSVELMRTPMSWRDELNPGCDLHQVL
jgi:hypothetical protein